MYRKIAAVCAILCVFFSLVSCASMKPLSEMKNVADVDYAVMDGTEYDAHVVNTDALRVGESYFIRVLYRRGGETSWRKLYDNAGISAAVDNPLYQLAFPTLLVASDPFLALLSEPAALTLSFPDFIGKSVTKALFVPIPSALPSFRGSSGDTGDTGEYGSDGQDGRSIDVHIARYYSADIPAANAENLFIVYDTISRNVWIVKSVDGTIAIDTSGGNGGDGGDGEDRKLSSPDSKQAAIGEDGAMGGRGGRGGDITVTIDGGGNLADMLRLNAAGGNGGQGGEGGEGEYSKKPGVLSGILTLLTGVNGADGKTGSGGPSGRITIKKASLDQIFLDVNNPRFDRARLRP